MHPSGLGSAIHKESLVHCICIRRCGGPSNGGKLISVHSQQRHLLRDPKKLLPSFEALHLQTSDIPLEDRAAVLVMGPSAAKRPCLHSNINADLI
jgi:hypothetical protein